MNKFEELVRLERSWERMSNLPKEEFDRDEFDRVESRLMSLHMQLKKKGVQAYFKGVMKAEAKLDKKKGSDNG